MTDENTVTPLLSDKTYDFLKKLVQIVLPALATLYFALAGIWNLPSAQGVVASITAITTFLGVVLGISTKTYNKSDAKYDGNVIVSKTEEGKTLYSLEYSSNIDALPNQESVTFKVVPSVTGFE